DSPKEFIRSRSTAKTEPPGGISRAPRSSKTPLQQRLPAWCRPRTAPMGLDSNLLSQLITARTSPLILSGATPGVGLTIGATGVTASYVSGSGTSVLVFRYTVAAGDSDPDGITITSPVVLNGGTIKDTAGNNASLTFTAPNTAGVLVDTTGPTV